MYKIIISGPESSGKTTLCNTLSNHFQIPFSKEYAREYLKLLNRKYTKEDLIKIAKKQLKFEKDIQLLDTDLITIKVWSNYKFGSCDNWILKQVEKQKFKKRFYILCKPDLNWEYDSLRENPRDRNELFELYKKELEQLNHDYYIVKGKNRTSDAISIILEKTSLI